MSIQEVFVLIGISMSIAYLFGYIKGKQAEAEKVKKDD